MHTKGEWQVLKMTDLDGMKNSEGFKVVVPHGEFHEGLKVADCFYQGCDGEFLSMEEAEANAELIAAAPDLLDDLCNVLEWAKGERGTKHCNPYGVPEVKKALQTIAKLQGITNYLDAKTK